MFDQLKEKIKENTEYIPPDLSNFYDTISLVHTLVPPIWKPKRKGYTQKAARLLWFSDIVERDIASSRELWAKELWYIHEYITGQVGIFSREDDEDFREINHDLHKAEFEQWCFQNVERIRLYAEVVGQAERAKAKTKRKLESKKNTVPF